MQGPFNSANVRNHIHINMGYVDVFISRIQQKHNSPGNYLKYVMRK